MSDVLERNLVRLFARAWRPPRPAPEFRARLEQAFVARAARFARPRTRRVPLWVAAAAAVVVVGLAWRVLGESAPAQGPDAAQILARGEVAWRAGGGPWNAAPPQAGAVELGARAAPLEVHTPADATAQIHWQGAALHLEADGALRLERVADDERAWLAAGALAASQELRASTFASSAGSLELESGSAQLRLEGDALRIAIEAGRARLSDVPAPRAVEGPGSWLLRDGRVVQPPAEPDVARQGLPGGRDASGGVQPRAAEPEPPAALRGRVRAPDGFDEDGSPRWRAVTEYQVFALPAVPLPMAATPERFEVADEEGRFALPSLDEGDYTIFVVAAGLAVWRSQPMALGEALEDPALVPVLDVRLDAGLTVSGTLRGADGAPLAGAVVVSERDAPVGVLPLDRESFATEFDFVREAVSDADGVYVLEHVARGPAVLRASGGGAGVAWLDDLEVGGARPLTGIDLTLPRPGAIGGRVLDADGAPRTGAVVLASAADFTRQRPTLSYAAAEVDAEGRYEISGLPSGTLAVLLFEDGNPVASSTPDMRLVAVRAGARRELDFLARRSGARLEGLLLDAEGTPMAARAVWVELGASGRRPSSLVSTTTDGEGRFVFEDLHPGPMEICVSGLQPTELALLERFELAPGEERRVELRAGSERIDGSVRGADGTPVSGALIVLLEGPTGHFAAKSMSDAAGVFEVPHLRPGMYELHVYPARGPHGQLLRSDLAVAAGVGVAGLELRLPPGAELELEVRDADGAPVAGAALRLFDAAGGERWCEDGIASDGAGHARVGGLGLGRWRVRAEAEGFAAGELWVDVGPGAQAVQRVVLERER